jgi:hypothetical protein
MGNRTSIQQKEKYFRSKPTYSQPTAKVDRDAGVINGVQIVREGEARGHGVMLDADFISDVSSLGNEKQEGLKSRFNHPAMSSGALGTYLGKFRNFRVDGTATYADLHLDASAKSTPSGNLYEYILNLAESAPDAFGNSISFQDDGNLYVKNRETGEKHALEYDWGWDDDEDWSSAEEKTNMARKVRVGEKLVDYDKAIYTEDKYVIISFLHASDLVDDPAATDGLFSSQVNSHAFAVQASNFLDANPEIWDFVERHPEKLQPFFEKYKAYSERKALKPQPPKMKKSLLQRLFTAFRGGQRFDIAITDTEGNQLSVVTDADTPAIGDEVLIIRDGEDPAPAPDGNYVAAEGQPNAGDTITVAEGQIADIVPAVVEEPTAQPTDPTPDPVSMSAISELQTKLAALQEQLTSLQAENERLRKAPLAPHTELGDEEDFTRGREKPTDPMNEAGRKAFEQGKRLAAAKKAIPTA